MWMLWGIVRLSSGSSERRKEPKQWLNFDDVAHCRNVESFYAFVEQFLSERGLVGEARRSMYWALFYRWKETISSDGARDGYELWEKASVGLMRELSRKHTPVKQSDLANLRNQTTSGFLHFFLDDLKRVNN